MILFCFKCRSSQAGGVVYQDEKLGSGMRAHNQTVDKNNAANYCCAICSNERGKS
jgi:ribosomal protein L37AE/L43A